MKFRFRANLDFVSGKLFSSESDENVSVVQISGAYRTNRDEFFDSGSYGDSSNTITPSMVRLPKTFQPDPTDPDVIQASKSTNDLVATTNIPPNLAKSTPNVSYDPRGATPKQHRNSTDITPTAKDAKTQAKEQKKLEKKRLDEQKKSEKAEAQQRKNEEKARKDAAKLEQKELAKQEKLRQKVEKAEAKQRAKAAKQNNKVVAVVQPKAKNPLARGASSGAPPAPPPPPLPPQINPMAGYSTNTLESSISKTSGPPPYPGIEPIQATNTTMVQNENDDTGNTSFGQPIESDNTWDLINQHRQQITRVPLPVGGSNKTVMKVKLAEHEKPSGAKKTVLKLKVAEASDNNNDGVTGRKSLYV